jgi:hypothetical protein
MKTDKLKVAHSIGKVEIVLAKMTPEKWPNLGEALEGSGQLVKATSLRLEYRDWILAGKEEVTHDVVHFVLKPPIYNKVIVFINYTRHCIV